MQEVAAASAAGRSSNAVVLRTLWAERGEMERSEGLEQTGVKWGRERVAASAALGYCRTGARARRDGRQPAADTTSNFTDMAFLFLPLSLSESASSSSPLCTCIMTSTHSWNAE